MTGNVGKSLIHIHVLLGRCLVKLVEQHTCVGERAAKRKRGQERGERGGVQDESASVEWHYAKGRREEGRREEEEVGRENRKEKKDTGREEGKKGKEGRKREGRRGCECAYYICVHMYTYKYMYLYICELYHIC